MACMAKIRTSMHARVAWCERGRTSRFHQLHHPAGRRGMRVPRCVHPPSMQEGQEYEPVPGSEFSVTRTAHRSNQSDYYINDRKVRMRKPRG